MVAVLAIAVLLAGTMWGIKMRRLSKRYAARAQFHSAEEGRYATAEARFKAIPNPDLTAHAANLKVWASGLRRKYERAARYPWLPVEPDPPGPQ